MTLSIVVPVYNTSRDLLRPCLDAVTTQTVRNTDYEVIIVDDCSSDAGTLATIAEYEELPHVRVIHHSANAGLNEARYSGTLAANGEYVLFVDGDDILTRDALESLYIEAARQRADVVTSSFFRWNSVNFSYEPVPVTLEPLPSGYIDRLRAVVSAEYSFTMCGRLFRKNLLTKEVFEVSRDTLHEDAYTFVRIMFSARVVAHVKRKIYYYTINDASVTSKFTAEHAEGLCGAVDDWINIAKGLGLFEDLFESMADGLEKLNNTCVQRCLSSSLSLEEKMDLLKRVAVRFAASPVSPPTPRLPGTRLLSRLARGGGLGDADLLAAKSALPITFGGTSGALASGLGPSDMARRLKDKVVFVCQIDYQVRNAAAFARALRLRGYACAILDNSAFADGGKRQLRADERNLFWRTEHIKVPHIPYDPDWLATARLVVVFNDHNDAIREALEFRHRFGLPSACMVEGINDFLRLDFEGHRFLPYRRCDHVFLAGADDEQYFEDRKTHIVGLPVVEQLCAKVASFPAEPLAVLNVNFTYGAREDAREGFVASAKEAFDKLQLKWAVTQHPMDKGNLAGFPVSTRTQYELIDECTVFVSRFATGILEALASGKPVVYFNPHGERVRKYADPMGAFEIARTSEELVAALRKCLDEVMAGVDFRARARRFLAHHANCLADGRSVSDAFADATVDVLKHDETHSAKMLELFFDRLGAEYPLDEDVDNQIFGGFDRAHHAQLNEEEMIGRYFGERGKLMLDVGANFGNSLDIYLGKNWSVHAFEPDPNNRKKLLDSWPNCDRLTVNQEAVSNVSGMTLPFYASDQSSGISGLSAFTDTHRKIAEVTTITLRDYYAESGIGHTDFLKIDVEGYDKFVLDGFPWEADKPDVVLAEYEDGKTAPLGYTYHDLANVMIANGYTVYVSEWHPIIRYGVAHDWRRLLRYPTSVDQSGTWGNLIGFLNPPDERHLAALLRQTLKFTPEASAKAAASNQRRATRGGKPTLRRRIATWARHKNAPLYRGGQFAMWCLRTGRRYAGLTSLVLLLVTALVGAAAYVASPLWSAVLLAIALLVALAVAAIAMIGFTGYLIHSSEMAMKRHFNSLAKLRRQP